MVTLQNALFGRISNRETALDLAKWAGDGYLITAAVIVVFALLSWPRLVFVAALYAICGYFTRCKFSRLAAVAGVSLSVLCFLIPFVFPGDRSGMLFAIVIWFGVRGIEATLKLHGRFSLQGSSQDT